MSQPGEYVHTEGTAGRWSEGGQGPTGTVEPWSSSSSSSSSSSRTT